MAKVVDYYFSLISPFTYLGSRRFEEILQRHRAEVRVKPVSLAAIFPKTGGVPPAKRAPERQAYRFVELERWSKYLEMPLTLKPAYFPAPDIEAARAVIAADQTGGDPLKLSHAILKAVWAEERNIADFGTLQEIAEESGHHATALMAAAGEPTTKTTYEKYTEEALEAGVFGAPTYVYAGELFWGQDRLDFLDRALAEG
ncbi:MAG: 2-hydroxychromene-2-carboxylate isomerase [Rhodovibrionaceae bacterium]